MKLHIISRDIGRIRNLSHELRKLGMEVENTFYYDGEIKRRFKLLKRLRIRDAIFNCAMTKKPEKDDVFLISISPSLLAPLTKKLHKKGFKTILDVRNSYQEWNYHGFLKQKLEKYEQLVGMKYADAVTFAHPLLFSLLRKHAPFRKLFFTSNGANTEIFYHIPMVDKISSPTLKLVYAGRFYYPHGLYQWIEVLKHVRREFHLTIVGYGDQGSKLRKMIDRMGLFPSIRMVEAKVSQQDLASYIQEADYALASINPQCSVLYDTTIETKTFEALCCGTPVLSIQGEAMDDFNRTGFSFNINFNRHPHWRIARALDYVRKPTNEQKQRVARLASRLFSYKKIAIEMESVIDYVSQS